MDLTIDLRENKEKELEEMFENNTNEMKKLNVIQLADGTNVTISVTKDEMIAAVINSGTRMTDEIKEKIESVPENVNLSYEDIEAVNAKETFRLRALIASLALHKLGVKLI